MTKLTDKNALEVIEKTLIKNSDTTLKSANKQELFNALADIAIKEMLEKNANNSLLTSKIKQKEVHYISIEYLLGRNLQSTLYNLGLQSVLTKALASVNIDIQDIYDVENDAGIGNGGLGRLAACFMDSLTTLNYRAVGHCILYEYGLFKQKIIDSEQREFPDDWIDKNEIWLMPKVEDKVLVRFGGHISQYMEGDKYKFVYHDCEEVESVPYHLLLSGYNSKIACVLKLWSARTKDKFDNNKFSKGDFSSAMDEINKVEAISKVLYPVDDNINGKMLRLKQQYFLCSSAIQDIIRSFRMSHKSFKQLPAFISVHINDTHPTLSIPELMRVLMDDYDLSWEDAWDITVQTISYTNHTVLTEALECWDMNLIDRLLPRIAMIIREIDRRFAEEYSQKGNAVNAINKIRPIYNNVVSMANLAIIGSHHVNGVSKIHTEILKNSTFKELCDYYPKKFVNVTNGVSIRRWLSACNPELNKLISAKVSDKYITNYNLLEKLKTYTEDTKVLKQLFEIKLHNKQVFADYLYKTQGIKIDPHSRYDVHVKRIHEYKRQLLNVLKIISVYEDIKEHPDRPVTRQTFIFGGKSAPGYYMAKRIIKLINQLSIDIAKNPIVRDKIKVVFVENFNVTISELLMPATDVTEQISLAGKEASGTGNMKAVFNGALMLGTYDGANIEICEHCGYENSFMFGLNADEVAKINSHGYIPSVYVDNNIRLKKVLDSLVNGYNGESFKDIADYLMHKGNCVDRYMVLADFDAYMDAYYKMDKAYQDPLSWQAHALSNISQMGYFSSDRSIEEYIKYIWKLQKID